MKTPVAFLIFNRPETTARVFDAIRRARPPRLLVVADGARADRAGEWEACRATRAIVERVDWECEVLTNFAESNMGCRARISSGLDWVFEQAEEAIILEDDCLPDQSFFPFCEELLERYRTDERVMAISGDNFHGGRRRTPDSYFFSRYVHIWGWASWRRAWRFYDVEIRAWPQLRDTPWLRDVLGDEGAARHWRAVFDAVAEGGGGTWDYQWLFACWSQHGLAVTPETNLVSNIGFGANSTHTATFDATTANLPAEAMSFPLRHPSLMVRAREADDFESRQLFGCANGAESFYMRARRSLFARLPAGVRRSITQLRTGSV